MMTSAEFVKRLKDAADNYRTAYALGTFGWPTTSPLIERAIKTPGNAKRAAALRLLAGSGCFMFDCIGLIKGILWGWTGSKAGSYGGAVYTSNGVPDIDDSAAIKRCSGVSTDFSSIVPGELLWMSGHVGVYIGDGKAIECTARWTGGVLCSAVANVGAGGARQRTWTKHGKMPWIAYPAEKAVPARNENAVQDVTKRSGVPLYVKVGVGSSLNMRDFPGTSGSRVIRRLSRNERVTYYGWQSSNGPGWYKVRASGGVEGWCSKQYLSTVRV